MDECTSYLAGKVFGDYPLVEAFLTLVLAFEEGACECAGLFEQGLPREERLGGSAEVEHASDGLAGLSGEAEEFAVLVELSEAIFLDVKAMCAQQAERHGSVVYILDRGIAGPPNPVVLPVSGKPQINNQGSR
jgi:hypothetical protein